MITLNVKHTININLSSYQDYVNSEYFVYDAETKASLKVASS